LQHTNQSSISEYIVNAYLKRTPASRRIWEEARKNLPAGSSRTSVFYPPYPSYASGALGDRITDVDGNERIDYCFNFTSLILGHRHPAVMKAVTDQLERGAAFGAPTELELSHADKIRKRMPSAENVRFTVTGTEACMLAIRLARAYTDRTKIAKFEGGYHGSSDATSVSVHPDLNEIAGQDFAPLPETAGLSPEVVANTVVLPFNDSDAVYSIIRRNREKLACIIVEPVMRGIPPAPGFLQSIRELASDSHIVLIFDEVITGFRISPGGAQEKYHVRPDLTTMGKVIGGGFPIGAVGGSEDIMSLTAFENIEFPSCKGPKVPHAGTFNAHPISLAAGIATLKELNDANRDRLDKAGQSMRVGLKKALSEKRINAQVTGVGSLFDLHFAEHEITDYRTSLTADHVLKRCLDLDLLNRGVFLPPIHFSCTSAATTEDDINRTLENVSATLNLLLPLIKERRPRLLSR